MQISSCSEQSGGMKVSETTVQLYISTCTRVFCAATSGYQNFSARSCEGSRPVVRYAGRSILCNCGRSSDHGSAGDVAAQEGDGT